MKHYLRALTAGILSAMLIQAVPAHASETTLLRPSDYISYDNIGNPVCYVDHVLQKGKFSLSANYQIGDIISDEKRSIKIIDRFYKEKIYKKKTEKSIYEIENGISMNV